MKLGKEKKQEKSKEVNKPIKDDLFLNGKITKELTKEEASAFSKKYHQQDVEAYDKGQNGMCYIVIGTIFAIISIIFVFLAQKKKFNKIVGLDYASLQFYIFIITAIIAVICLALGLYRLYVSVKKRKDLKHRINVLNSIKDKK